MLARLLLGVLGILVGFVLVELAVRLFLDVTDMPHATWDISLGIRTDGNQKGRYVSDDYAADFSFNSFGWNQPREYTPLRTPGTTRVAVVGDSFVEALQVSHEDTFSAIAEKQLTAEGMASEWYSFGTSGYGTAAEYMLIRNHVLDFSPDVTILLFVGNDVMDSSPYLRGVNPWDTVFLPDEEGKLQLAPSKPFRPSTLRRILGKSALVRYLVYQKRLLRPRNRRLAKVANQTTLKELDSNHSRRFAGLVPPDLSEEERARRSWELTEKLLVAARDECERRGSEFLLVSVGNHAAVRAAILGEPPPDIPESEDPWCLGFRLYAQGDLLSDITRRHDINFVDLTAAQLSYVERTGANVYFASDGHWSSDGHRAVADALVPIVHDILTKRLSRHPRGEVGSSPSSP